MYCNYCGKVIQDDANVCAYCGQRVGPIAGRTRLLRPPKGSPDRKIAGVCAAFAEYFDLDVTVVRVVWLLVAFLRRDRPAGLHRCLDRNSGGSRGGRIGAPGECAAVSASVSDEHKSAKRAFSRSAISKEAPCF